MFLVEPDQQISLAYSLPHLQETTHEMISLTDRHPPDPPRPLKYLPIYSLKSAQTTLLLEPSAHFHSVPSMAEGMFAGSVRIAPEVRMVSIAASKAAEISTDAGCLDRLRPRFGVHVVPLLRSCVRLGFI
jgi:hypothetical protein